MSINFLYRRRESLTLKSERLKDSVRAYLEEQGYSQTTDSSVEGTFEDMVFYNPTIAPGKRFIVETKAGKVSVRSKAFADQLVKYFKLWKKDPVEERFELMLFVETPEPPEMWGSLFSDSDNVQAVDSFYEWFNKRVSTSAKSALKKREKELFSEFLSRYCHVTGGDKSALQDSTSRKTETSAASMKRIASNLIKIVNRRRSPLRYKSSLITNLIPIEAPPEYYAARCRTNNKHEIYDSLKGASLPPFVLSGGTMLSFCEFDASNPLSEFAQSSQVPMTTQELQRNNPRLASELVNIHLRRLIWCRGVYRDPRAEIYYYPVAPESTKRFVKGPNGRQRLVVKQIAYREDTDFGKKGAVRFYFHKGVELRTPTYWHTSYVEIIPRRYYTYDGRSPMESDERTKIDVGFKDPRFDRSESRLSMMKMWKYLLFESDVYAIHPEPWFGSFKFGTFATYAVDWCPRTLDRNQFRLWDFQGEDHES